MVIKVFKVEIWTKICILFFLVQCVASAKYYYYKSGTKEYVPDYDPSTVPKDEDKKNDVEKLFCEFSHDTFTDMYFLNLFPNLESIDAHTCGIAEINYDLHVNELKSDKLLLFNFQSLDLSNNRINQIKANCFTTMPNIQTLNLSNNIISSIKKKTFEDITVLTKLDLSRNSIASVDNNAFEKLDELDDLNLSGNKLIELDFAVFANNVHLKTINCNSNEISQIISGPQLRSIISIDLSNNQLQSITNLVNLPKLQSLKLSDNPSLIIDDMPTAQWSTSLTALFLRKVNLFNSKTVHTTLSLLESLATLDIGETSINHTEIDNILKRSSLKQLWIDGNNLTKIDYENISKNFQNINIDNNFWDCDYLNVMISYLNRKLTTKGMGFETIQCLFNTANFNEKEKMFKFLVGSICVILVLMAVIAVLLAINCKSKNNNEFKDRPIYSN